MPNPTYLFYDIETTGLNKCFDQVLQFAAIRTDESFNELSRDEIQVTLNNDVIPSPGAVITHRIGVDQFSKGISEYDAMQKIHALFNTPNTISVGYNTLGFDDEFLRFSFYKNLLPPYTHQYANNCGRMDIYPITLLYYLFKKDHLIWPSNKGVVSLKLENINLSNHFAHGQAHNAMFDVEVTLALAKKLHEDKTMWHFVTDYFQKKIDENRIAAADSALKIADKNVTMGFMVNAKIGAASQFIAPVIHLGQHQHYKNQSVWLRLDNSDLINTKSNAIKKTTKILRKRLAEPPIFLPIKDRYLNLLSDDRKNIFVDNQSWLEKNSVLFKAISDFYQHEKYPEVSGCDADAALYMIDFPTPKEENVFRQFHAAKDDKKESVALQIQHPVRQAQAMRILGRHFREHLSEKYQHDFEEYLKTTPIDFRGEKKLTRENALVEIDQLMKNKVLDEEQQKLLGGLKYFVETSIHRVSDL